MERLKTDFLGINFKNPLITSSGCFGYGLEYKEYFDPNILGGIGIKGLTLEARDGNLGTRIAETPAGMLNCVGLENPGVDYFVETILPRIKEEGLKSHIIANINGKTVEDYVEIAKKLDKVPEIAIIEVNISCPNVKNGGMAFGANPEIAGKVTREVRQVTSKPLVVKLSPNVTDIVTIAKKVEENGADAISLINTLLGMAIDINTKKPVLGNVFGGFSGPAVKPVALRMVYQVYKAVNIPIIGMGGIANVEDALEFIMAGASIISIGSAIFANPMLPVEIIEGLKKYCTENNISNIKEIVGIAHK